MKTHTRARPALLTTLICLLALLMVACGGGPGNGTPQAAPANKQVMRYPIGSQDFGDLDPATSDSSNDYLAVSLIFGGLVHLRSDNSVAMELASSYHVSSDGLSYTFKLKPGLEFSDGTPLTATDVAYSINRALLPTTASPTAAFLVSIKDALALLGGKVPTLIGDSLIVQDPQTITIVLSSPASYFLQELAGLNARVVNRALIDKYGTSWTDHLEQGAGAGLFKVASYSHSQGMVMVPNTNYSGTKARLQKFEFVPSGDAATVYKEYLANQIDFTAVPLPDLASAKTRKDFHSASALSITFLQMNYLAKPFDNVHIRQAFDLAIDKDVLASTVLRGAYAPTNHIVPSGMPGYSPNLKGPIGSSTAGDKTKAKQLLQQGMQEEGDSSVSALPALNLTIASGSQDIQNVAEAIVQQWQNVLGITVQLKTVDPNTFIVQDLSATTGHTGPLQLWLVGYSYLADPYFWLNSWFGASASFNFANYGRTTGSLASEQQAVQQELARAAANPNPAQRFQEYNDAEQKIVNDVGWAPLIQGISYALINSKLQNVGANGPDGKTMTWSDVYVAQ